jgi:hypothetical protein
MRQDNRLQPFGGTTDVVVARLPQPKPHRRDIAGIKRPCQRGRERLEVEPFRRDQIKPAGRRVGGVCDGAQALP